MRRWRGSQILILAPFAGALVGLVLGLIGGGGSILAVPLLIFVVGVSSTHVAIGTSAVAVAASAAINLLPHWRQGHVKWPCAMVFGGSGVVGALAGSNLAKLIDGGILLGGFGVLMLVVGLSMLMRRKGEGNPDVRLSRETANVLGPRLIATGFGVGALSGFFGIGGGFLIVPGLMLATGMPLIFAIGTSLVGVTAFGVATAFSYAASGLVDWPLAGLFVLGGAAGGAAGAYLGQRMAVKGRLLDILFAALVIAVGLFIAGEAVFTLAG